MTNPMAELLALLGQGAEQSQLIFEGTVIAINPLKVRVNGLDLDGEDLRMLSTAVIELGMTALLLASGDGQTFYLLGGLV